MKNFFCACTLLIVTIFFTIYCKGEIAWPPDDYSQIEVFGSRIEQTPKTSDTTSYPTEVPDEQTFQNDSLDVSHSSLTSEDSFALN